MKLTYKNARGLVLTAENPDESISLHFQDRIKKAVSEELRSFVEECRVAMRKLQPGQTVKVESRPIVVELSSPATIEAAT